MEIALLSCTAIVLMHSSFSFFPPLRIQFYVFFSVILSLSLLEGDKMNDLGRQTISPISFHK